MGRNVSLQVNGDYFLLPRPSDYVDLEEWRERSVPFRTERPSGEEPLPSSWDVVEQPPSRGSAGVLEMKLSTSCREIMRPLSAEVVAWKFVEEEDCVTILGILS